MTATATPAAATKPRSLTERQRQILDEIVTFHREKGYCPTFREIQAKFGFASVNAVVAHLRPLRSRGLVTWVPKVARTLRPTGAVL